MTPEHFEAEATYHRTLAKAAQSRADALRRIATDGDKAEVRPDAPEWMRPGSDVVTRGGGKAYIKAWGLGSLLIEGRSEKLPVWYDVCLSGMRRSDGMECQSDIIAPWTDDPDKRAEILAGVGPIMPPPPKNARSLDKD